MPNFLPLRSKNEGDPSGLRCIVDTLVDTMNETAKANFFIMEVICLHLNFFSLSGTWCPRQFRKNIR